MSEDKNDVPSAADLYCSITGDFGFSKIAPVTASPVSNADACINLTEQFATKVLGDTALDSVKGVLHDINSGNVMQQTVCTSPNPVTGGDFTPHGCKTAVFKP